MLSGRWLGPGATIATIVGLSVAIPSLTQAQAWMADRQRTQGPGIRLGDFELHPGIGVEIGYDSNLYYSSDDGGPTTPVDSGILRATAHLNVSTRTEQRAEGGEAGGEAAATPRTITFVGGLSGSFYTFFADLDRTNMEVDANLALGIRPGGPFSLSITEQFGRSIRPFTENFTTTASYARIQNNAGVLANFATTGDVLKISLGYNFNLDFFEDQLFQYGNRFQHVISLRETFRFLPQTAIVHDTTVTVVDYFNESAVAPTLVNDSVAVRSRIGLNGAFTTDFSVLASVGYAAGFYNASGTYAVNYESLVAQIEARWKISENSRLVFGYDRDFQSSFVGNYIQRDRGYAAFQTLIDRVFLLGVDASFGYHDFGAIVEPDGVTPVGTTLEREDLRFIASIFAEYRFTDWLGVNATLRYTGNYTDYVYLPSGTAGTLIDPASFNKFEAWLGVRVFY